MCTVQLRQEQRGLAGGMTTVANQLNKKQQCVLLPVPRPFTWLSAETWISWQHIFAKERRMSWKDWMNIPVSMNWVKYFQKKLRTSDMAGHGCLISWCFNVCNSIEKCVKCQGGGRTFTFYFKTAFTFLSKQSREILAINCNLWQGSSTRWSQPRRRWSRRR